MKHRSLFGSSQSDEAEQIVANDSITNALGVMIVIMTLTLSLVNTPGKNAVKASDPTGNVKFEIYWPNELNTDVDQWTQAPQGPPVGYSNKGGMILNLLRDDLGNTDPNDPINYESTMSRGIYSGRYCNNVHLYSNRSGVLPIRVKATVKVSKTIGKSEKGDEKVILSTELDLVEVGQERNLFCFWLDEKGELITEGEKKPFTSDYIKLRSAKSTNPPF
jgi:hypothetical protein